MAKKRKDEVVLREGVVKRKKLPKPPEDEPTEEEVDEGWINLHQDIVREMRSLGCDPEPTWLGKKRWMN